MKALHTSLHRPQRWWCRKGDKITVNHQSQTEDDEIEIVYQNQSIQESQRFKSKWSDRGQKKMCPVWAMEKMSLKEKVNRM